MEFPSLKYLSATCQALIVKVLDENQDHILDLLVISMSQKYPQNIINLCVLYFDFWGRR